MKYSVIIVISSFCNFLLKNLIMKKILVLICTIYPILLYSQNVVYIYSDSILLSIPEYQQKVVMLDSLKNVFQAEIKASQSAMQIQYSDLLKPYSPKADEGIESIKKRMTAMDTLRLIILFEDNAKLQDKILKLDSMLAKLYMQEIQPILEKVNALVSEYAKANKVSMVFAVEPLKPALIYLDPKSNITDLIIRKLKVK